MQTFTFKGSERAIERLCVAISSSSNRPVDDRAELTKKILRGILARPAAADEATTHTREDIDPDVRSLFDLDRPSHISIDSTKALFRFLGRCVIEASLWDRGGAPWLEFRRDLEGFYERIKESSDAIEKAFLFQYLHAWVIQQKDSGIQQRQLQINDFLASCDQRMAQLKERIDLSETLVKRTETQFNFVGLAHAFKSLLDEKRRRLALETAALVTIGAVLLFPFYQSFTGNTPIWGDGPGLSNLHYGKLIAILGFDLITLYFFRIVLVQRTSTKAQILQLELRQALCAFVQSYAEFAAGTSKKAPETLSKFETLVFSNIVADETKIPSTFDGVDQLAKLISTATKGNK